MIAEHEVGYASMDGTLAPCDRLCRLHRRGDVSQAARREAARLTRVQRDALIGELGLVRLTVGTHQPLCLHRTSICLLSGCGRNEELLVIRPASLGRAMPAGRLGRGIGGGDRPPRHVDAAIR
jgi:hypothetical protein